MSATATATPMEALQAASPEGALTGMDHRAAIMDTSKLSRGSGSPPGALPT